jgi:hypothetical protein
MASISALAIANARIPTSCERRRIRDVRAADLQEEMAEQPSEHRSERSEQSDTAQCASS